MSTQTQASTNALYRHGSRPAWGLAIIAWERGDHRGYQFEDGQVRVFKRSFFPLLTEVDPPADVRERALDRLHHALGRSEVRRERRTELVPVSQQIAAFRELYPDGFADPGWLKEQRGVDVGRSLKRHREPLLVRAGEQLAREPLASLLAKQAHAEVLGALLDCLEHTDLVSRTGLGLLNGRPFARQRVAAEALFALLHGEDELPRRFDSWVAALERPGWELATAPLAIFAPQAHICVRLGVFETQAQWLAPRMHHAKAPAGHAYLQYLELTRRLVDVLRAAELPPRDLLDVHDFIYVTLRPAMRQKLLAQLEEQRKLVKDDGDEGVDAPVAA